MEKFSISDQLHEYESKNVFAHKSVEGQGNCTEADLHLHTLKRCVDFITMLNSSDFILFILTIVQHK